MFPLARTLTRRFLSSTNNNNKTLLVRALSSSTAKPTREFTEAHVKETVPKEDYYQGHLMADHLEYLDDMMEKAVKIESSMDALKETYGKKKDMLLNVKWTDSDDIDALFTQSAEQKAEISKHIQELQALMKEARKTIAYDAPDGTSPDMEKVDLKAVEEIIDFAETHENKQAIEALHAQQAKEQQEALKTMAVDNPEGIPDDVPLHEKEEIEKIIDYAETHENKEQILKQHAMEEAQRQEALKTMAVDNPEGIPDEIPLHEKEEIEKIIDYAETHEDKEAILKRHKQEQEIMKERARDPEHNW